MDDEKFIQIAVGSAPECDDADMLYGITNKGRIFKKWMGQGGEWKLVRNPNFKEKE